MNYQPQEDRMIEPYTDMNIRWWPDIAASLTKPWPQKAALMDLRYQDDQVRMGFMKRPMGRGKLATRWGWKPNKVYDLLQRSDEWKSNLKRADRFPTENKQKSEAKPPKSQEVTNRKKTGSRQNPKSSLIYNKTTKQQNHIYTDFWAQILDAKGGRKMKLNKKRIKMLKVLLDTYTETNIIDVVKWWQTSNHSRAQFLREGSYSINTILNEDKFEQYFGFLNEPTKAPAAGKGFASSLLQGFLDDINDTNVIPFSTPQPQQVFEAEYEEKN